MCNAVLICRGTGNLKKHRAFDKIGEMMGINPKCEEYRILSTLHCVNFEKMPRELVEQIPALIQKCISMAPIFQFKTLDQPMIDIEPQGQQKGNVIRRLFGENAPREAHGNGRVPKTNQLQPCRFDAVVIERIAFMFLTENEAKKKWCPMTAPITSAFIGRDIQLQRDVDRCTASDCMMWQVKHSDGVEKGYCGLSR